MDGNNANQGTVLYNAMIAPLISYPIKGAIWYQGESNAGRAAEYETLFPTMIQSWRKAWKQDDMPFFFVQLAPFQKIEQEPTDLAWARLREAQRLTLKLPKTGMAVITDVGDEKDIHPKRKEPVGARLALAARAIAYGQKIDYSGPSYENVKFGDGKAILSFQNLAGGLEAKGGELTGFTIAGDDKVFYNADAMIQGDTIVVSSAKVAKPAAVRFGWANYPVVNLWNKAGLPASPFRTDDWAMETKKK
jgi:sialate O-acetylesterase